MNIVVSGWPGAGSSTLSLLLSNLLGYKLIQGSQTFRYLGKQLGFGATGLDRIKIDTFLEKYWGPTYDKYIDHILINDSNLLVESDIAAFRVGKNPKIFSIFLTSSLEVRKSRLKTDDRSEDIEFIKKRDEELRKEYIKLTGVDWTDKASLEAKYNLVLDSTTLNIAQVLEVALKNLGIQESFNLTEIEQDFWELGKIHYLNLLTEKELICSTEEMITNIRDLFPTEIEAFPLELRSIISSVQNP